MKRGKSAELPYPPASVGRMSTSEYRDLLVNPEKLVYLAACSHSPLTKPLLDSMERYKNDLLEFGNPWDLWLEKVKEAVRLFARLINVSEHEVFPSFSVSSALASVLSSLKYGKRKRIIVSDMEYPTTNFIFLAQRRYGARVTTLRNTGFALSPGKYRKALDDSTLLTSAIHVSSINGFRQDVTEICSLAHEVGSFFYTDAYQSLGTIPVDAKRTDVDFLASGNLKFLLGLPGIAFMYVRKDLVDKLEPTNIGWFSQKDPFLFGARKLDYSTTADRFQSGTLSIPSVYAAIGGMETILDIGVKNIQSRVSTLTDHAIRCAEEHRLKTITPLAPNKRGAIVSFIVKHPHKLENKLRSEGIITSSRGMGIRLAPHFYNTMDDIDVAVSRIGSLRDY